MTIDLRSDTVTRPTSGMLEAMLKAETGDDVFGEDPSVNRLEERAAAMFGMEAALFCPSGTMSNQIGIKVHTQPGDEVICEKTSHVYQYEGGGIAFNAGAQVNTLDGHLGRISADQVEKAINNPFDVHKARTSLVSLENTVNRGGGGCYSLEEIGAIRTVCDDHQLNLHLDGARLFNALVAKGQKPEQFGALFDSISICLNKGLGCPAGSILMGKKGFIQQARRVRKVLGGGMRQAGYLAACGLYAFDHHIQRLEEDHRHAQTLAHALKEKSFVESILPVETNIVIAEISASVAINDVVEAFHKQGILVIAMSPVHLRLVTHLDISAEMINRVVKAIHELQLPAEKSII